MTEELDQSHPHAVQRVLISGEPLGKAQSAIIALHGRGADAEDIAGLAQLVARRNTAILAPRAAGHTWYPYSFLEPIERNEPYLSSAIRLIGDLLQDVAKAGIPAAQIALLGFSQGACLASEFVARNPRRYAGLIAFSGGLIGPLGTTFDHAGSLDGTPVFLGCSDVDFHIPKERVEETANALTKMGATVEKRLYSGMGHTVNEDEVGAARKLLESSHVRAPGTD
jgi:predicted esterase